MRLNMNDLVRSPVQVASYPKLWSLFKPQGRLVQINIDTMGENGWPVKLRMKSHTRPDCVRIHNNTDYMGRLVENGRHQSMADQGHPLWNAISSVLRKLEDDPINTIGAYGIQSGICGCCSRELTDPVSIKRGIGPICLRFLS